MNWKEPHAFVPAPAYIYLWLEECVCGLKYDNPLHTDTATHENGSSEEWKAGHAAAFSKVKEIAEELIKVGTKQIPLDRADHGYNIALADLLDHLKTIE